eukprot:GHVU01014049.1.p1 GENE.GHVU01014049.1~~GHVU01014049.1.p1  ORF type:complete len:126 (-),score=5.14 GHVU01014049.1:573-950(-)
MQTLSFRVGALSSWEPSIPEPRNNLNVSQCHPVQFDGRGEGETEGMCGRGASRRRPATASLASAPQVRVDVVTSTGHVSPITFTRGCVCGCARVCSFVGRERVGRRVQVRGPRRTGDAVVQWAPN